MTTNETKIIDKINKLLSLADNNPSQEEAHSAALKAQELMAQYNIEQSKLGISKEIEYCLVRVQYKQKKRRAYNGTLGAIVAQNFRCRSILINMTEMTFFGQKQDAEAAKSVFEFLYNALSKSVDKVYRELRDQGLSGNGECSSYMNGYLAGIQSKFAEQCKALMIVTPKEVNEKYEDMFPDRRPSKSHVRAATDAEYYHKGIQHGKEALGTRSLNT